jgi:hypothetical protein
MPSGGLGSGLIGFASSKGEAAWSSAAFKSPMHVHFIAMFANSLDVIGWKARIGFSDRVFIMVFSK